MVLHFPLYILRYYATEYEIGITTPSGMPLIIYLSSYCITRDKEQAISGCFKNVRHSF